MEKPLVSVIVPVYNVEEYLEDLIRDILEQTVADFELLLVNNNSEDGAQKILDRFREKDARVRVFQQRRPGAAAARNMGLDNAVGEYIVFFDADDRVGRDILETLLDGVEGFSLCLCGYMTEYKGKVVGQTAETGDRRMDRETFLCALYEDDTRDYQGFIWNKIFCGDIIRENHLRFWEEVSYNEDRLFVTEYMMYAENVHWISARKYHYQVRDDSAMSASREYYATESERTEIKAFDRIIHILEPLPEAQKLAKRNMAIAQIRLFRRILDRKHFLRYRKSSLRKYAKHFRELGYEPKTYNEKVLCKKLVFFGYTGISYSGVDARQLR